MTLWHPTAERIMGNDGGSFVTGIPARGVLHTTEGESIAGAVAAYRVHNTWPHFTVGIEGLAQHVPIDRAARALKHPPGTVETNRARAIQIEVVWRAADASSMPGILLAAVRGLMRWCEANAGIRRAAVAFTPYPASYGLHNGVRMSSAAWLGWSGWCGHQHVPGNDHGDPGLLNIAWLLDVPNTIQKGLHMILVQVEGEVGVNLFFGHGDYVPIEDPADRDAILKAGVPFVTLKRTTFDLWAQTA